MELVHLSPPTPNNPLDDQAKHCSYHRNQCHNIEEFFKVKEPLKKLIRSGALNCFRLTTTMTGGKVEVVVVEGEANIVAKQEARAELSH